MPPIQRDARRLIVKTSGRLELCLMDLASAIAEKENAKSVTPGHVRLAMLSLAGENARLLQSVLTPEQISHVTRAAG